MPVLVGFGFPRLLGELSREESDKAKVELVASLREAVASVEELGIESSCVSVFIPQDQIAEGLGEELIVQITGLYETPERTPSVLYKLSSAVVAVLMSFAKTYLPKCQYVEASPTSCRKDTVCFRNPAVCESPEG